MTDLAHVNKHNHELMLTIERNIDAVLLVEEPRLEIFKAIVAQNLEVDFVGME